MNIKAVLIGSLLCTLPMVVNADSVQKWVDDKGQVHYSDKNSANAKSVEVKVKKAAPPSGKTTKEIQYDDSNNDNGNYGEAKPKPITPTP